MVNISPSAQAETTYDYETTIDLKECLEESFNTSMLEDNYTCPVIRELVSSLNLTCANFTQTIRHTTVGKRDGMNILGIIIFSVTFAIALSRQAGGRQVVAAIGVLNEAIMKLVALVMWWV